MPTHPYRQRLLAWLDALPEVLPLLTFVPRTHRKRAMEAEHLAIAFNLGDQAFRITHSRISERQAAAALVECRFGHAPQHRASEALQRLLSTNFQASVAMPAGFCLDGTSGEVWLCTPIHLERDTLDELVHAIVSGAQLASLWRERRLLDRPTPAGCPVLTAAATRGTVFLRA
ncbi:MAG TPA: CesT family type III secretion system chaperone [Hydrogenophaga sp.]|uniref:CesT family type III secretion system chaperone n=1 Tax=Hydrogenophaga sp. TaxID=1904254 RepID=UPI002CF1358D|nr:CesT family type III secretion system chaperone [Hydrogenophaga sp.]HSX93532.1 CesT family type III secretion system chaperone [Hydrogenophaga sp.]